VEATRFGTFAHNFCFILKNMALLNVALKSDS